MKCFGQVSIFGDVYKGTEISFGIHSDFYCERGRMYCEIGIVFGVVGDRDAVFLLVR